MSEKILTDGTMMAVYECPSCGVSHGIPSKYAKALRNNGGGYYCPNGHWLSWGESKADKLKKELSAARDGERQAWSCCRDAQEQAEHLKRSRNGMKGALVRTRNRLTTEPTP